ncbi:Inosine/uridine-preferring nucleoside hydrolase domain-containing protein [Mycena amicta]|nr:Inosine/uridine-preferring nucleoside hydrolase domain-containing protein [Mycena amicta]
MTRTPVISSLFALASPELELLAFIPLFGNTDIESAHLNVLKTYAAVARHLEQYPADAWRFPNLSENLKPILARGSVGPLQGDLHNAQNFHGRDGLGSITERHPELTATEGYRYLTLTDKPGVDVVLDLIQSRPARTITYIALGPLTDLARLMQKNPSLVRRRIGRIVCMGGALDVPGNASPVAEFNFFADPFAVKQLLVEDEHSTLLPLDRFIMFPLDNESTRHLKNPANPSNSAGKSPLIHFTSSFLEQTRVAMLRSGKDAMELHDIVAVWCAIENPPVSEGGVDTLAAGWKARRRIFDVERTGELTRGFLVVDRREDESAYAPGANRAEVQAELEKLNVTHDKPWESTAIPALVETEQPPMPINSNGVVSCYATPGPAALLDLLLKRIWACD